jgi:hypothetical protein
MNELDPMPQAFTDAVCNERAKTLRYFGLTEDGEEHARGRRRGIEGANGVACTSCRERAAKLWIEYQRIHKRLADRVRP